MKIYLLIGFFIFNIITTQAQNNLKSWLKNKTPLSTEEQNIILNYYYSDSMMINYNKLNTNKLKDQFLLWLVIRKNIEQRKYNLAFKLIEKQQIFPKLKPLIDSELAVSYYYRQQYTTFLERIGKINLENLPINISWWLYYYQSDSYYQLNQIKKSQKIITNLDSLVVDSYRRGLIFKIKANIYRSLNSKDSTIFYFQQARQMLIDFPEEWNANQLDYCLFLFQAKNYIIFETEFKQIDEHILNLEQKLLYRKLKYNYYSLNKRYDLALISLENYILLKDSIVKLNNNELITTWSNKINSYKLEQKIQRLRNNNQQILIISLILLILIIILIFYILYNQQQIRNHRKLNNIQDKVLNKKKEFIRNLSHEIRNPLNVIIGLVDIFKNDIQLANNKNIQLLEITVINMLSNVNNILSFEKLNHEKVEFKKIKIKNLIVDIIATQNIINQQLNSDKVNLCYSFHHDIPEVIISDENKLTGILTNLVYNAIKFTERGHVKIELAVANTAKKEDLIIKISDTGYGMEPKQLKNLFQPFNSNKEKRNSEGTGLGLYLIKSWLDLIEGQIDCTSELNIGTVFKIRIPLIRCEDNNQNEDVLPVDIKAILVEDDPGNQILMRNYLQQLEITIIAETDNVIEAEKLINYHLPDIIVSDCQLKDGYCFDFYNKLNLPVKMLLVTGETNNINEKFNENQLTYISVLNKPFAFNQFKHKILKLINQKKNKIPSNDEYPISNGKQDFNILNLQGDLITQLEEDELAALLLELKSKLSNIEKITLKLDEISEFKELISEKYQNDIKKDELLTEIDIFLKSR